MNVIGFSENVMSDSKPQRPPCVTIMSAEEDLHRNYLLGRLDSWAERPWAEDSGVHPGGCVRVHHRASGHSGLEAFTGVEAAASINRIGLQR